jgi:hypothetical protein
MVNELSQNDTGIAFKQKWVKKYWTLMTMGHMETKEIDNYAIDLNNWLDKKKNTMSKIWRINLKPWKIWTKFLNPKA